VVVEGYFFLLNMSISRGGDVAVSISEMYLGLWWLPSEGGEGNFSTGLVLSWERCGLVIEAEGEA